MSNKVPLFRTPSGKGKPPRPKSASAAMVTQKMEISASVLESLTPREMQPLPELAPTNEDSEYVDGNPATHRSKTRSSLRKEEEHHDWRKKKEHVNGILKGFRRPSLPSLSSFSLSGSIGEFSLDSGSNQASLILPEESSDPAPVSEEPLDESYVDDEVDLQADVEYIRKRLNDKRAIFKEKIIPQENKLFDFSQLSKHEARQRKLDHQKAVLLARTEKVSRDWKEPLKRLQAAEADVTASATLVRSMSLASPHLADKVFLGIADDLPGERRKDARFVEGKEKRTITSVFGDANTMPKRGGDDRSGSHHHHRRRSSIHSNLGSSADSQEDSFSTSSSDSENDDGKLDELFHSHSITKQSTISTLPEVKAEQGRIVEAIEEWAHLKDRNYAGKYHTKHKWPAGVDSRPSSPHKGGSDGFSLNSSMVSESHFMRLTSCGSLPETSANCLADIVIDAVHEDDIHYEQRGLDDDHYFGEAAKLRFFGKFQQVSANHAKKVNSGMPRLNKDRGTYEIDSAKLKLLSPRSRFLTRYVTLFDNPPLPIIIRLNRGSEELNLANMMLRDDYILLLSEVLNELPKVTIVNVRNNQLTDRSICPLIETLAVQDHITELDISQNKLDDVGALALSGLVRSTHCPLKVLKMACADVSDSELALFTSAFEVNKTIVHLDMSRNFLGASEKRNDFAKDISFESLIQNSKSSNKSAGESIASALILNKAITTLDLSWNKLGALSAAHLSNAIGMTRSVTDLNLAYNGIKDIGAEALAASLFNNTSLRFMNVSYNGITAEGCIYFAASLKLNSTLERFDISGNPIGDPGGIALIHSLNYQSLKRELLIHSCTYPKMYEFDNSIPKLTFPTKKFVLNLKYLRDKVVALELFRLASMKRGCIFKRIEHSSGEKTKKKTIITLNRPQNPADHMGHVYGLWRQTEQRTKHPYCSLTADDWMSIANRLELVDAKTGWPWILPTSGILTVDFVYYPRCATPIDLLNATGLQRLITMLSSHRKTIVDLLRLCTQSIAIETEQMAEIMHDLSNLGDGQELKQHEMLEIFVRLLPCVRDVSNVDALIKQHFTSQYLIREIQLSLRSLYFVMLGSYSGHYILDLSDEFDRLCAIRLAEIDAEEMFYINRTMPHWAQNKQCVYTSQSKTRRTNFRNVCFKGANIEFSDDFFSRGLIDKAPGTLEFDYISTSRPAESVKVVGDYDLNGLLVTRGLRNRVFGTQAAMDASLLTFTEEEKTDEAPQDKVEKVLNLMSRKTARRSGVAVTPADPKELTVISEAAASSGRREGGRRGGLMVNESMKTMARSGKSLALLAAARFAAENKSTDSGEESSASEDNFENKEERRLSMGGLQQVSKAAASFMRKFKQMKVRLGTWLFHDKYRSPAALVESLHVHGAFLTKGLSKEGALIMYNEVVKQDALYYAGDALQRFVVRVAIRIHSKDTKAISKIKAIAALKLEQENAARAAALISGKLRKVRKVSKGDSGKSLGSTAPARGESSASVPDLSLAATVQASPPVETRKTPRAAEKAVDISYYGSILEACCVYSTAQSEEDGSLVFKHTGTHPYPSFAATQPLDSISYIKLKPNTITQGMRSDPTHKRFKMYEDVSVMGTEIVIRVKCTHWSSMKKIEDYAKGFMNKLFPAFKVRPGDLKTTSVSSSEAELDIFADPKLPKSIQTHVVFHQIDMTIEQIPFAKKSLLKVQLSTMNVGSLRSMGSLIFGRQTSNNNNKGGSGSGLGGSGTGGNSFSRLESSTKPSTPTESKEMTFPENPDAGKMFIVWRWRDIDASDRDCAAPDALIPESYRKKYAELRGALGRVWLTCKQAVSIVNEFPLRAADGHKYREDAIVSVFARITDIENFGIVLDTLPQTNHASLYNRIGWLNAVNMFKINRYLDLDLRIDDNRRLASAVVTLFVQGGGITLLEQKYRRNFEMDFIPGWEIPAMWDAATYTGNLTKGVPTDGNFIANIALKDDEHKDKLEKYNKLRAKIQEEICLLAVPRGDGSDIHLTDCFSSGEQADYDGLKR